MTSGTINCIRRNRGRASLCESLSTGLKYEWFTWRFACVSKDISFLKIYRIYRSVFLRVFVSLFFVLCCKPIFFTWRFACVSTDISFQIIYRNCQFSSHFFFKFLSPVVFCLIRNILANNKEDQMWVISRILSGITGWFMSGRAGRLVAVQQTCFYR